MPINQCLTLQTLTFTHISLYASCTQALAFQGHVALCVESGRVHIHGHCVAPTAGWIGAHSPAFFASQALLIETRPHDSRLYPALSSASASVLSSASSSALFSSSASSSSADEAARFTGNVHAGDSRGTAHHAATIRLRPVYCASDAALSEKHCGSGLPTPIRLADIRLPHFAVVHSHWITLHLHVSDSFSQHLL